MTKYAIRIIESDEEIMEQAKDIVESLKNGYMSIEDENGNELTPEQIAKMSEDELLDCAYDIMGDEWGDLWYYPDGSQGLDQDSAQVFDTEEEVQAVIDELVKKGLQSDFICYHLN